MDFNHPVAHLSYLHEKPLCSGDFRTFDDDFIVEEVLGFEPSGEGQHVCLFIEKRGENTQFIAKALAELAGIRARDVSYGGLKDRHAVTRQWFSVDIGANTVIDFSVLNSQSVKVLKEVRHNKKLRIGSHKANRFSITLRNISDIAAFDQRFAKIAQSGVPNYFGEQRFGNNGNNLFMAQRMFGGENIRDRKIRSLVISAARSWLFNQQVSARIAAGLFAKPLDGDIFRLSGSRSFFTEAPSAEIEQRLSEDDIQIAALLPGEGELGSGESLALAQTAMTEHLHWAKGLAEMKVKADCRPLVLKPLDLKVNALENDTLNNTRTVSFTLPVGSFATAVLREWIELTDCSKKPDVGLNKKV